MLLLLVAVPAWASPGGWGGLAVFIWITVYFILPFVLGLGIITLLLSLLLKKRTKIPPPTTLLSKPQSPAHSVPVTPEVLVCPHCFRRANPPSTTCAFCARPIPQKSSISVKDRESIASLKTLAYEFRFWRLLLGVALACVLALQFAIFKLKFENRSRNYLPARLQQSPPGGNN